MESREGQSRVDYNHLRRALALSAIFLASLGAAEVASHNKDIINGAINVARAATGKGGRNVSAEESYLQTELAHMKHQRRVRVMPGDGIYDVIEKANGDNDIFSNGPAISAEYQYIKNQAPGGVLQRNQIVRVPPVIPFETEPGK